jgi:secreted PhoX family phosphatase
MRGGAPFTGTASETAADRPTQFGMHNDGMHFFPIDDEREARRGDVSHSHGDARRAPRKRGVLYVNNEYTHEEVLFADRQVGAGYSIAKTRKSQATHGVSIVEARR